MGNFNIKSIWKQNGGTGGSTNLEQRVQAIENGYFKKENGPHQIVRNSVDFYANGVFKNEAFVDVVGNGNTNIVNKQYVDTKDNQNVKLTGDQSIAGVKTFNNGFIVPNSAEAHVEKDITNANDNQIVNYKGFYWKRIGQQNNIALNNGATTAFNITTSELRSQKHVRIMVRITPNNYDYTMVFDLTLNSLSYKNFGEVKTLHWADNTASTLDPTKFIYVTAAQFQNNAIRINIRNATGASINTGTIYIYIQTIKPKFQL